MAPSKIAETDHFWYRLGPEDVYVESQRDNRAFGYAPGRVMLSEDNAETWPHSIEFADASKITFSTLLANGTVLWATGSKLFRSADNLKSYEEVIVKDLDGSDYLPHTPQAPERPGWYFHTLPGVTTFDANGREMLAWGNYCNVLGGASPVNIYYSADGGETVKIAYAFGQNPLMTDNGSNGGGRDGTLLGNPDNPVRARHVHTVACNPAEDAYYSCTGDGDREGFLECHWLRGAYDWDADEWDWRVIHSDHLNSRYKAGGISFVDGMVYWISDSNGPQPYDRGVFRCAPEDITNKERHELLFNPEVESGNMIVEDDVLLASHCAPASPLDTGIIISTDGGETWAQYDLKEFGKRSPTRLHAKNSDGWFRMDLRKGWIEHAEVLYLKPKQ